MTIGTVCVAVASALLMANKPKKWPEYALSALERALDTFRKISAKNSESDKLIDEAQQLMLRKRYDEAFVVLGQARSKGIDTGQLVNEGVSVLLEGKTGSYSDETVGARRGK